MKRILERLRKLANEGATPDELQPLLKKITIGVKLKMHGVLIDKLYRSRPYTKNMLYEHVDQLKYPPPETINKRGRLNDITESIFYCADSILGTVIETKPEINTLIVMSTIVPITKGQVGFVPIGMKREDYPEVTPVVFQQPETGVDKLVVDFLNTELTRPYIDESSYTISIAIAHHFLYGKIKTIINNKKVNATSLQNFWMASDNFGLLYPSVQGKDVSNTTTHNLAMLPETYDQNFRMVETEICSLTHDKEDNSIAMIALNKGEIDESGKVTWRYNLQKMKSRTKAGIFGLDPEVSPRITLPDQ